MSVWGSPSTIEIIRLININHIPFETSQTHFLLHSKNKFIHIFLSKGYGGGYSSGGYGHSSGGYGHGGKNHEKNSTIQTN